MFAAYRVRLALALGSGPVPVAPNVMSARGLVGPAPEIMAVSPVCKIGLEDMHANKLT